VIPEPFTAEWVPNVDGCQPCPDRASHWAVKSCYHRVFEERKWLDKCRGNVEKKCHVSQSQIANEGSSDVICEPQGDPSMEG
jgi:hypothetical protein